METSHEFIHDEEFKARHRTKPEAFTRMRKLTCSAVMIRLLQTSQVGWVKCRPMCLGLGRDEHDILYRSQVLLGNVLPKSFALSDGKMQLGPKDEAKLLKHNVPK